MQLLYNSDSFTVVQIDVPSLSGAAGDGALRRGGYEIVDKFARKEIFIEGLMAERFEAGVRTLVAEATGEGPTVEAFDEYLGTFAALAQQPLAVH